MVISQMDYEAVVEYDLVRELLLFVGRKRNETKNIKKNKDNLINLGLLQNFHYQCKMTT